MCGNFDIILVHLTRVCQPSATPIALCAMHHPVPILIGWCLVLALRCYVTIWGRQGYALLAIQLVLGAVYTLLIKHNTARVECKELDAPPGIPDPAPLTPSW